MFFQKFLLRTGPLLALLLLWECSGRLGWVDQTFLPSLTTTLGAVVEMWQKSRLFMHISVSLTRVLISLLLAMVLAVPGGYLLGQILPRWEKRFDSLFKVLALINPYCLFPLFVVFFGAGEVAKLAVLTWVSFWPILFSTITGIHSTEAPLLKTARSLNCSRKDIFFKITLPSTAPFIFYGLRLGVEMSFFILIAAEMTGATAGLGWIVHNAGAVYQVPRIYGAGFCIVVLGVFLNRFFVSLQNGLFFWKESVGSLWGRSEPEKTKKLSRKALILRCLVLVIILVVGISQMQLAEALLNDPQNQVEYRIWSF
jgi:NitT/TauT family transport system permease protein